MRSLAPQDYAALPALAAPAAYVCVVRDIDRDRYRIEATCSPQALVAAVVAEERRSFGIELVALLQSDDLAASEAELYARHDARLSGEWLALDVHQLEELRGSALQIDAFASHYLMTAAPSSAAAGARYRPGERAGPRNFQPAGRAGRRPVVAWTAKRMATRPWVAGEGASCPAQVHRARPTGQLQLARRSVGHSPNSRVRRHAGSRVRRCWYDTRAFL